MQLLKLLTERGPERVYFPDPSKLLFLLDTPGQEEADKKDFVAEGLVINFVSSSQYLGSYIDPQEELTE